MNRIKWLAFVWLFSGSISFAAEPVVRVFEGQVTDYKGKPVPNASVEWGVFNHTRESREVFRTDDEGHYRVETTKAGIDYRLGVSASGLAPQWRDGLVPRRSDQEPTKVDFKLTPPITLRGRVVDRAGVAIAGVTIFAQSPVTGFYSSFSQPTQSFPYPGPERAGTTNAEGKFTIRNLPNSAFTAKEKEEGHRYALSVRYPSGGSSNCGVGNSKDVVELILLRAYFQEGTDAVGEIRGNVVDFETDQPIRDFAIVIRHRPAMNLFSDDGGEFQLREKLQFGRRYQLFVYADGYAPTILYSSTAKTGSRLMRHISLAPNPSMKGVVVNEDGQPIADAQMLFGLAYTDPNNPNLGGWSSWRSLVDGMMGWETVQRKTTAADGKFSFCLAAPIEPGDEPVKPTSRREKKPRIMIKAPGYARIILDANEVERRVLEGDMMIALKRECAITVKPLLNGKFDPNAKVIVSRTPSRSVGSGMEPPDLENQTYRIGALDADRYRVTVSFPISAMTSTLTRMVEFDEPKTVDLTMDYRPGNCTLRGKAPRFSSITVSPEWAGTASYRTSADADGLYVVEGLAAGKYNVSCRPAYSQRQTYFGRTASSDETVDVHGETTHDIALEQSKTFRFSR